MLFISASLDSKQEKTIFRVYRLLCYRTPKKHTLFISSFSLSSCLLKAERRMLKGECTLTVVN